MRDYHRLEILVCNYQRRMDQYGYWVNNFCPLVSRENNFSLYLVDCRGNNLYFPSPENSEITVLDELLSSLPTEETPMPEIAIAPFRQIILSYDPNEFQPVIEPVNGWIVTQRDFMENDWDYCPVLNDNPIINTTYWPISLYDIKMWYDMMHGGVIWTRGNSKMPNSSSLMAFRQ